MCIYIHRKGKIFIGVYLICVYKWREGFNATSLVNRSPCGGGRPEKMVGVGGDGSSLRERERERERGGMLYAFTF